MHLSLGHQVRKKILIKSGSDVPRVRLIDFGVGCFLNKGASYSDFYGKKSCCFFYILLKRSTQMNNLRPCISSEKELTIDNGLSESKNHTLIHRPVSSHPFLLVHILMDHCRCQHQLSHLSFPSPDCQDCLRLCLATAPE